MRRWLIALSALLAAACSEPPAKFHATDVTGADWGRDFSLRDAQGKQRRLADFSGKAVVLFFGFTQCPDICPTTLATTAAALKLLGPDASKVQVIFVTLDPARDTPEVLAKYPVAFNPDFIGLTGSEEEIAAAAKTFKVFHQKQPGATPGDYSVDHTAASYAFDPRGNLRLYIRHGTTPEQLASDLKQLIAGK